MMPRNSKSNSVFGSVLGGVFGLGRDGTRSVAIFSVSCLSVFSLLSCSGASSSGGNAEGGGGAAPVTITALNHTAAECVQINGKFEKQLSETSTQFVELRTTLVAGGAELINVGPTAAETSTLKIDGQLHAATNSPQNGQYRGACMGNAMKIDLLVENRVVGRIEYILEGAHLKQNLFVLDAAKLPGAQNESIIFQCKSNCRSSGGGTISPTPGPTTPPAPTIGVKAPSDMQMRDLPENSYIEITDTIGIYFERLSQWPSLDKAVALFQNRGSQVYGPGHPDQYRKSPSYDPNYPSCSFELKLSDVLRTQPTASSVILLVSGTKFQLTNKVLSRNTAQFAIGQNTRNLINIGCDNMTVDQMSRLVFGGKLSVYVQTTP